MKRNIRLLESPLFELEKVSASSFSFVGNKYKENKVENFIEKDDLDQSFYDDTKILSFIHHYNDSIYNLFTSLQ